VKAHISKAFAIEVCVNRDLGRDDLSERRKFLVQISMGPLFGDSFDKELNSTLGLAVGGKLLNLIRKRSALVTLDQRVADLLDNFLCQFVGLKLHESAVELLEQRPKIS